MRKLLPLLLLFFALPLHAASADLQMFVDPPPANATELTVRVVNSGPDLARNLGLLIDVPQGLTLESVSDASCDKTQSPIRCTFGIDLAPGVTGYFFRVRVTQDIIRDATYALALTITSDTPDPDPATNTRTLQYETRIFADLNVQMFPPVARIDPGATQRFRAEVANYFNIVTPRDVHVDFTLTNGTFETVEPPAGVTCAETSATTLACFAETLEEHCWCLPEIAVTVRAAEDRNGGATTLTAHASSNLPEAWDGNDQATGTAQIYRWIIVETIADDGAGSLRDAIVRANGECDAQPCRIAFEIPAPVPAEGWFTILPASPLPAITADRVAISGASQTAFTGDTNPDGPEIAIDGRLAHRGLEIQSPCEGVVENLALGNFDENQALWTTVQSRCEGDVPGVDRRLVRGNFIGVDPSGKPWPNLRGLRADDAIVDVTNNVISHNACSGIWMWRGFMNLSQNTITHNGASGVLVGPLANANIGSNTISFNAQMGVAAARSGHLVDIRQNSMKDNGGLGIDHGLDGVSPVDGDDKGAPSNAPVLLSAVCKDGKTYVTFALHSGPLGPYGNSVQLDFYANDNPDGDGEQWIGLNSVYGEFTAVLNGDYRGKWINATSTRTHFIFAKPPDVTVQSIAGGDSSTSEFSNAVLVQ